MDEAVRLVLEENLSVKRASLAVNRVKLNVVPRMTLNDRMNRHSPVKLPPVGRPTELDADVEEAIVKCLVLCGEYQCPMKRIDVQKLIQSYCTENNVETRWTEGKPGLDWVRAFQKRWSHRVKLKKPTNIKRSRAKVSPEIIREYMAHLQPELEKVPASNIFNYDETNLRDDPGSEEAFFGGGSKYNEQIRNSSKEAISLMFCCSADGQMLPPMVLYKSTTGICYDMWIEGGPEGTTYAASKSGWFDMEKFNQWFKIVFLPHIKTLPKEQVKVLIGDNLAAHLSPYVLAMCELHNVRFCFLPENSTHLLQPLDVTVFAPMKRKWREVLSWWKEECMRHNRNFATLPKKEFPALLKKLMEKDYSESIKSGFACCGIFPFSLERALSKMPPTTVEIESQMHEQVLKKLQSIRYDPAPNAKAGRPTKKQKHPAGASLTCVGSGTVVEAPIDLDKEMAEVTTELRQRKAARTVATEDGGKKKLEIYMLTSKRFQF